MNDWEIDEHWLPFDGLVEICLAPNLLEPDIGPASGAWIPADCILRDIGQFQHAPRLATHYENWRGTVDPKKLEKDGTKYVLTNHPTSETDEHFVRLLLRKSK